MTCKFFARIIFSFCDLPRIFHWSIINILFFNSEDTLNHVCHFLLWNSIRILKYVVVITQWMGIRIVINDIIKSIKNQGIIIVVTNHIVYNAFIIQIQYCTKIYFMF